MLHRRSAVTVLCVTQLEAEANVERLAAAVVSALVSVVLLATVVSVALGLWETTLGKLLSCSWSSSGCGALSVIYRARHTNARWRSLPPESAVPGCVGRRSEAPVTTPPTRTQQVIAPAKRARRGASPPRGQARSGQRTGSARSGANVFTCDSALRRRWTLNPSRGSAVVPPGRPPRRHVRLPVARRPRLAPAIAAPAPCCAARPQPG